MSTEQHSLSNVIEPDTLQTLGNPDTTWREPDAEIAEWEDMKAVTAPGYSAASSIDRLKGRINPLQLRMLEGFDRQVTGSSNRVVFVGDRLKNILGDKALAKPGNLEETTFSVEVRLVEELADRVAEYREMSAKDPVETVYEKAESNDIITSYIADPDSAYLLEQTPMALFTLKDRQQVLSGDDNLALVNKILDEEEKPEQHQEALIEVYEAEENKYNVTAQLPPTQDDIQVKITDGAIEFTVNNETYDKDHALINSDDQIKEIEQNNGIYNLKIN